MQIKAEASTRPLAFTLGIFRCLECTRRQALCPHCEEYANQDYVPLQEELTLDLEHSDSTYMPPALRENDSSVDEILSRADLTSSQGSVLRHYFIEGKDMPQIGLILGISK